jgi:hypothetical protein
MIHGIVPLLVATWRSLIGMIGLAVTWSDPDIPAVLVIRVPGHVTDNVQHKNIHK